MRMIAVQEIVSILTDFENGEISKEKRVTLFRLLDETVAEMEAKRKLIDTKEIIMNCEAIDEVNYEL